MMGGGYDMRLQEIQNCMCKQISGQCLLHYLINNREAFIHNNSKIYNPSAELKIFFVGSLLGVNSTLVIFFYSLWPKMVYFIRWPPLYIYYALMGCLHFGPPGTPSLCPTSFASPSSRLWGGTQWGPVPGWRSSAGGHRSSGSEWLHLLGQSYTWQRPDPRRLATRWKTFNKNICPFPTL